LKTLTYSNDCSESRIKLFRLSISLIGLFSPVYICGRLPELFSGLQMAFGTTFRVAGGYLKAGKRQPKIVKTINNHTKNIV
jgi:hypothetical protein